MSACSRLMVMPTPYTSETCAADPIYNHKHYHTCKFICDLYFTNSEFLGLSNNLCSHFIPTSDFAHPPSLTFLLVSLHEFYRLLLGMSPFEYDCETPALAAIFKSSHEGCWYQWLCGNNSLRPSLPGAGEVNVCALNWYNKPLSIRICLKLTYRLCPGTNTASSLVILKSIVTLLVYHLAFLTNTRPVVKFRMILFLPFLPLVQ